MSTESSADDLVFQALPLTGDAGDAFVGIAVLLQAVFLAESPPPDLHERAMELASKLVARAYGAPGAPTDAELRAAAVEASETASAIGDEQGFEVSESLDEIPEELMVFAEEVLREAALEYHTHDAYLALQGDTDDVLLVVVPLSVAAAHVGLLANLFNRMEAAIAENPLAVLERGASAWWFERWRPAKPIEGDGFAAGVREQEWSFIERPTLALDTPFIDGLLGDEEMAADIPPRQRHMARQLLESVLGIWQVRERTGDDAMYISAVDGTEHPVKEHAPVEEYGTGAVVIGRLIPFGDGTWLRSPGAVTTPAPRPEWTRTLTEGMKRASELDLAPAIVLEAALTHTMTGERVPRSVPPARSASEARQLLKEMVPIFLEAGLATPTDGSDLPPDVRASATGPLVTTELDDVVGEWMQALSQMARKGTGGSKSKAKKRRR
jgi:hypothetical protein